MDNPISILLASFLCAIIGVLFFLYAEKNTYTKVLINTQGAQSELSRMQREMTETKQRLDDLRKTFMDLKVSTQQQIDQAQEHCARLREQQQLLRKRQNLLSEKMVPQKIEFTLIEGANGTKKNPALINKIKSQLKGLEN